MTERYNSSFGFFGKKDYDPTEVYRMNARYMGESPVFDRDDDDDEIKSEKETQKEEPEKQAEANNTVKTQEVTQTTKTTAPVCEPKADKKPENKTDGRILMPRAVAVRKVSKHSSKQDHPFLPGAENWGTSRQYE